MLMNAACARMTMVLMAAPLFSALFAKMGGAARKVRGKRRANASSSRDRRKSVQMRRGPAKTCACHEKGAGRRGPAGDRPVKPDDDGEGGDGLRWPGVAWPGKRSSGRAGR